MYEHLRAQALNPDQTRQFIENVAKEYAGAEAGRNRCGQDVPAAAGTSCCRARFQKRRGGYTAAHRNVKSCLEYAIRLSERPLCRARNRRVMSFDVRTDRNPGANMPIQQGTTHTWTKSSYSTGNGACVEVKSPAVRVVAVRDSKDPSLARSVSSRKRGRIRGPGRRSGIRQRSGLRPDAGIPYGVGGSTTRRAAPVTHDARALSTGRRPGRGGSITGLRA